MFFFVQSILADQYIHRRELRLVSSESLPSVEYGIEKIFSNIVLLQGIIQISGFGNLWRNLALFIKLNAIHRTAKLSFFIWSIFQIFVAGSTSIGDWIALSVSPSQKKSGQKELAYILANEIFSNEHLLRAANINHRTGGAENIVAYRTAITTFYD